ncbi:MAG TPA: hypothetical protein DIC26_10370 [Pseudomonas sp.]|nr:hypothetical protein [Pseudomonas sp.]
MIRHECLLWSARLRSDECVLPELRPAAQGEVQAQGGNADLIYRCVLSGGVDMSGIGIRVENAAQFSTLRCRQLLESPQALPSLAAHGEHEVVGWMAEAIHAGGAELMMVPMLLRGHPLGHSASRRLRAPSGVPTREQGNDRWRTYWTRR